MAKKTQYSKIKIKRSSVAGVIPTMGPTNDHTDGSWNGTDIYPGEFFINLADNRVWFGSLAGPTEIVVPGTFGAQAITYSDLSTLKTAGGLTPGQLYIITDRGDQGIVISAIDDSNLSISGTRIMNCPAATFYTIAGINLGVWYSGLTPTAGDKVIWGGKVWTNNAGVVGTATDDETLSADWTVVAKPSYGTSNASYDTLIFDIKYDFDNDWISEQSDLNGNVFGLSYQDETIEFSFGFNPVDICDWNRSLLFNNRCIGIWNNSRTGYISYNQSRYGNISNNSVGTSIARNYNFDSIRGNSNAGGIVGNLIKLAINNNSNTGSISNNSNTGNITTNSNGGSISDNINTGNINNNTSNTTNILSNSNNGNISSNSNTGTINFNSNLGAITSNSNTGNINFNSNNGGIGTNSGIGTGANITNNSNNGDITFNSSNTGIYSGINRNSNNGSISTNSNTGNIDNNSNNGSISFNTALVFQIIYNSNLGDINNNSNNGEIQWNSNLGYILNNSNSGLIQCNSNAGFINGCASPATDISFNNNNGSIISYSTAGALSDTIVNK